MDLSQDRHMKWTTYPAIIYEVKLLINFQAEGQL